jgi:hypothetical protein
LQIVPCFKILLPLRIEGLSPPFFPVEFDFELRWRIFTAADVSNALPVMEQEIIFVGSVCAGIKRNVYGFTATLIARFGDFPCQ